MGQLAATMMTVAMAVVVEAVAVTQVALRVAVRSCSLNWS
tara:strand:- start:1774 stop:1893 length:120 start_codon:yes stop_codon:yes gene_type:complete